MSSSSPDFLDEAYEFQMVTPAASLLAGNAFLRTDFLLLLHLQLLLHVGVVFRFARLSSP